MSRMGFGTIVAPHPPEPALGRGGGAVSPEPVDAEAAGDRRRPPADDAASRRPRRRRPARGAGSGRCRVSTSGPARAVAAAPG